MNNCPRCGQGLVFAGFDVRDMEANAADLSRTRATNRYACTFCPNIFNNRQKIAQLFVYGEEYTTLQGVVKKPIVELTPKDFALPRIQVPKELPTR